MAITLLILIVIMAVTPVIFKGKLIKMAKTEINKNINAKIEFGDFNLNLFTAFPYANFIMHDFCITGLEDFSHDTLLRFNKLELRIGLFSLGSNQLEINAIILNHPIIKTKVLKDGQVNWDIAKESASITTNNEPPSTYKLNLRKIKIIDGEFVYDDIEMNLYTEAKNIQGTLSGDMVAEVTKLQAQLLSDAFSLNYGGINYISNANLKAAGGIETDLANSIYTFHQNEILLNNLGLLLNGTIEMPADDIILDLAITAKQNDFKNFLSMIPAVYNNNFKDLEADGKMAIEAGIKGIYNENQMPGYKIKLDIEDGMFKYPDLPKSVNEVVMSLKVSNPDGVSDHTIIDLEKLHLNFAGNPIDARLLVHHPVSDPDLTGMFKGRLDLSKLKDVIPLKDTEASGLINSSIAFKGKYSAIEKGKYDEFNTKGEINIDHFSYKSKALASEIMIDKANLEFKPQYLDLKSFDARMGKSNFQLNGKIENYLAYLLKNENLKGHFNLNSSLIDLNELMQSKAGSEIKDTTSLSVFKVPENVEFVLLSKIDKLFYDKLEITDLKGNIAIKDSKIEMKDLLMQMLDGSISMNGYYETKDMENPSVNFSLGINEIDFAKTFSQFKTFKLLAPIAASCLGKFSASIDNYSSLLKKDMMPNLSSINAKGLINSKSVQITNAAIFTQLGSMLNADEYKSFNLKDLMMHFVVKDGGVEIKPFVTKIKNTNTTISGFHALDQTMNYNLKFAMPRTDFRGANQALNNLLAKAESTGLDFKMGDFIEVNAAITGTITNPKITLDLGKSVQNAVSNVKDQINAKVDVVKSEAIIKAEAQANQLLQMANIKADQLMAVADSSATRIKQTAKSLADKIRAEAELEAKKIEDKAGTQSTLLQLGAKKAADKMRVEAEKKAKRIEEEAALKADQVLAKANTESDQLKKKAKEEGDKIIAKAKGL